MKFSTGKKMIVLAASVSCMFSMVGCMMNIGQSRDSNNLSSNSASSSEITTFDTSSLESSEITDTVQIPSETLSFEERVDKIVPSKNIVLTEDEIQNFLNSTGIEWCGSYYLGFANPLLKAKIQEYFSDNTLEVQDLSGVHSTWYEEFYNDDFKRSLNYFDIDYVRYVLEENGLRLWVDEIPYEFFAEKFPDYVKLCNDGKYIDLDITFNEDFVYNVLNHHNYVYISDETNFDGRQISLDYSDSKNEKLFRLSSFIQLVRYNYYRDYISSSYLQSNGGRIEQGLTEDGRYVWVPTEKQYNSFQEQYLSMVPRCENVDILVPESREDLVASGIDVEKYDDFCEKFYGGAKMEKNKTQDDQSRSRQG